MKLDWEIRTQAVIARLDKIPANVRLELQEELPKIGYELQAYIQQVKLSGGVLNVKSGALRSHIFMNMTEGANYIQVVVSISVGQVPYAGIHEYGGSINHPGGTAYGHYGFVANRNATAGMPRTAAHVIPMPERSYMRSSMVDRKSI